MDYFKAPGLFVKTNSPEDRQAISPLSMNSNLVGFIGIAERGEINKPVYIRSFKEYTKHFGEYNTVGLLPYSVKSFFDNGGEHCIVIRNAKVSNVSCSYLRVNGEGGAMEIKTRTPGEWGNNIHMSLWKENADRFSISFNYNGKIENYLHLSYNSEDDRYFKNYINKLSKWCKIETDGNVKSFNPILLSRFSGGNNGLDGLTPGDIIGKYTNPNDNYGIATFEKYDDITLIALPDVGILDKMDDIVTVQKVTTMIAERHQDRFVVLDVPDRLVFQDIKDWSNIINSRSAGAYYPNILIENPVKKRNSPLTVSIPPSGAICGIISSTDRAFGPYMPPSGGSIVDAFDVSRKLNTSQQELLFSSNINYLKYIRGNGIKVWGARTLVASDDSEWKHINVRRAFSRICKFLKHNTEWAVFEPNTYELRKDLIHSVNTFLLDLFRKGYFAGQTADEAFYVYCGEENNPEYLLDRGIITIDVGVALVRPTEFFNIRLASNKESSSVTFGSTDAGS